MIFILIAAILWGATNPFLKKYTQGFSTAEKKPGVLGEIAFLLKRPKYLLVQGLNISGSVAFFMALRTADVSIAAVTTNALAFVFTVLVSVFVLKEGTIRPRTWAGLLLVLVGISLCILAKEGGQDAHPAASEEPIRHTL